MMIGNDYVALPVINEEEAHQMASNASALTANVNAAIGQDDEAINVNISGGGEEVASDTGPQE